MLPVFDGMFLRNIQYPPTLVGTDTGSYTDGNINFSTNVLGASGLSHNEMTGTAFDLTVTEYSPVGGVICGTFSGQVKDVAGGVDVYDLTEGYFCVKRQADNSISFE